MKKGQRSCHSGQYHLTHDRTLDTLDMPSHRANDLALSIRFTLTVQVSELKAWVQESPLSPLQTWRGVHPGTLPTVMKQRHAIMIVQNREAGVPIQRR